MIDYIVDSMTKADGDAHDAWLDLQARRQEVHLQHDLNLAAAEEYMFARYTGGRWWMPSWAFVIAIASYNSWKATIGWLPSFGKGPVSPYSDSAADWQLMGLSKGWTEFWHDIGF